ncbi:MAG: hypothetical protein HY713_01005 [candidate division NC10 bacterium]|nr:hypothetical protein [candidate division NC10 bacterium]
MMRARARRRHHVSRIKRRVRRYYGGYAKDKPRHLGRIARTRQLCSCWMCGNPRRYLGERSLQERRAFQPVESW